LAFLKREAKSSIYGYPQPLHILNLPEQDGSVMMSPLVLARLTGRADVVALLEAHPGIVLT
jgi:hypothetical protein